MTHTKKAIQHLNDKMSDLNQCSPIPFSEFLDVLSARPSIVMRNIFQVFHDMVKTYVKKGADEYPDDPESINFVKYDFTRLFIDGSDYPFFPDRLFANRIMNLADSLRQGAQQNKIYIFEGPPGCGKSTFLNNLLKKFEEYANTEEGLRFETVWKLDRNELGGFVERDIIPLLKKSSHPGNRNELDEISLLKKGKHSHTSRLENDFSGETIHPHLNDDFIEVSCPSHDNPILLIPRKHRRSFFDDLLKNDEFKWKLFTDKEYEWAFKDDPCTICSSIYQALLSRLKSPLKVYEMLYARHYKFNKRLGIGISVFNPGDKPVKQNVLSNSMLQRRINGLLRDSNQVKYIFSRHAKTNNGIYALMDIKSHNTERLIELHNIISEGLHKVEDIEENVNSLFLAVMNPEDKKNVQEFQSFSDRIENIKIPYVLDLNTEVEIYRNIFGKHIDESFLPMVLHNFARVIISSRLHIKSETLLDWIGNHNKYLRYCDANLQLLKMEVYTGYIPSWLTEEDRKRFNAKRRKKVIAESETEGARGFSGRDSIKIFYELYSTYAKEDKLINMSMLCSFFSKISKNLNGFIPRGFLDSLVQMYNYTILQEVKESLYYYNEEQISRDIKNYLFAINFEEGSLETCNYTGDKLEITEDFFESIEKRLLGIEENGGRRLAFRKETQKEYASNTLTRGMMLEGKAITETELYNNLQERYIHNLKEKVLHPFLENENFRRAIKDYGNESFKAYDKRIQSDVAFLIKNLCNKYKYNDKSSKEVCIYVIDNNLALNFEKQAARH